MTRPRPSEVIAGIRSVLADVVAPELTSDHARSRLAEIRAVLAQIDWDDAAFSLKARALRLEQVLDDASTWVDEPLPLRPCDESLRAYEEFLNALGAVAVTTVERLGEHVESHPNDDAAHGLHRKLLGAL